MVRATRLWHDGRQGRVCRRLDVGCCGPVSLVSTIVGTEPIGIQFEPLVVGAGYLVGRKPGVQSLDVVRIVLERSVRVARVSTLGNGATSRVGYLDLHHAQAAADLDSSGGWFIHSINARLTDSFSQRSRDHPMPIN